MKDFESLPHVRWNCKFTWCVRRDAAGWYVWEPSGFDQPTGLSPHTQAPTGPFPVRGSPRCAGQAKPTPSRRGRLVIGEATRNRSSLPGMRSEYNGSTVSQMRNSDGNCNGISGVAQLDGQTASDLRCTLA